MLNFVTSPVTNPLLNRSAILLKRSVLSDSCSSRKTNDPNGEIHNAVDVPNIGAQRTASMLRLVLAFSVEPAVACDCLMSQKRTLFLEGGFCTHFDLLQLGMGRQRHSLTAKDLAPTETFPECNRAAPGEPVARNVPVFSEGNLSDNLSTALKNSNKRRLIVLTSNASSDLMRSFRSSSATCTRISALRNFTSTSSRLVVSRCDERKSH